MSEQILLHHPLVWFNWSDVGPGICLLIKFSNDADAELTQDNFLGFGPKKDIFRGEYFINYIV